MEAGDPAGQGVLSLANVGPSPASRPLPWTASGGLVGPTASPGAVPLKAGCWSKASSQAAGRAGFLASLNKRPRWGVSGRESCRRGDPPAGIVFLLPHELLELPSYCTYREHLRSRVGIVLP